MFAQLLQHDTSECSPAQLLHSNGSKFEGLFVSEDTFAVPLCDWLGHIAWAHMFWGYEKPAEKSQAQVFYFLWDVFYFLWYIVLFLFNSLSHCNSGKMQWPILQQWFCSVTSPCIFEAIHWSLPSHRAPWHMAWSWIVCDLWRNPEIVASAFLELQKLAE